MEQDSRDAPEDEDPPGHAVVILFAVFVEVGLAPFSVLLGWLLGHPPLATFVWSARDAAIGTTAALPLIVLFLLMLHWPVGPLARVRDFCEQEVVPLFHESHWSELALIALSAGVGEEMLFRGVVQASLAGFDWLGTGGALILASVLFGVLHPISISYIVITSMVGLYLGAIWIGNGNLLTVMVTHAVYDFVALGYLIRLRSDGGQTDENE